MTALINFSGKFMANKNLISASDFLSLLTFYSLVIFITVVSSLNFSSSSFSCSLSRFLHNHQFQYVNHQNNNYFHLYHLRNLPYVKIWRCFINTTFFYISYSIIFWSFFRADHISNRFFSCNLIVCVFISFVLTRNMLLIWCYTCWTFSLSR